MNNVVTALGNPILNNELKRFNEINILLNDLQYKEAIIELLEKKIKINYLILSESLPGEIKIEKLVEIIKAKEKKLKIILIREKKYEKENNNISQNVDYQFLNNQVDIKDIIEIIHDKKIIEKEKIKDGGKLYTKITDLLTNNSVINKSASKMNDKELLTFITRYISVPLPPPIKQEDFNDLVKVGIKEDNREALWRLAVNYDKKMDFTLIEDYFIDKRDSYYLIELISATDSVNLDNIVSKVVATNDREFMIDLANRSLELSIFTKEDIDKIKEKYNL